MGFSFPKIKMPPIRLPPVKLPPPIKINIPPVKLPPPPPPLKKIVLPPPTKINIPPVKLPPQIKLPPPPPKISLPTVLKITLPPPIKVTLPPPIKINIPPPKVDMKALQTATGIITGVISMHPIGRALITASVGIADAATKGKATEYLNNGHKTNGTLSMIPGGRLIQSVANEASGGKSGDFLNKIPDPKKSIMQDIGSVGKTIVTNPNNMGNTLKTITQTHINNAKPTLQSIITAPSKITSTLIKPVVEIAKPSLLQAVKIKEDLNRQIPIKNTLVPVSTIAIVPFVSTLGHDPLKIVTTVKKQIVSPVISTLGLPTIKPPVLPTIKPPILPSLPFFTSSPSPTQNIPVVKSTLGNTIVKTIPTVLPTVLPTQPFFTNPPPPTQNIPVVNSTLGNTIVIPTPTPTPTPVSKTTLGVHVPVYKPVVEQITAPVESQSEIPIIPIALLCLGIIILIQ